MIIITFCCLFVFYKSLKLHISLSNIYLLLYLLFTQQSDLAQSSIFTGEEELFAFSRTKSRLSEMMTEEYWRIKPKQPT